MPFRLGKTPSEPSGLRVFGLCPLAARFMGGFWAFNGFQEIPISTFGHWNACRQSRRGDCGLSHACLRSSAACAVCGVLCVLDGFVLKCPKVETMFWMGSKSRVQPILVVREVRLVARGVRFGCALLRVLCLPRSDDHICLLKATIIFARGERRKKDAPKGALHANKFPRRGASRPRRQCA